MEEVPEEPSLLPSELRRLVIRPGSAMIGSDSLPEVRSVSLVLRATGAPIAVVQ